jgi:hypothetical protein
MFPHGGERFMLQSASIEGASELIGNSCPKIPPKSKAEKNLLERLGGKKVGILLSSGQSKEISIENEDGHGGFFTNHLISAIRAKSGLISNRELIVDVTQRMSDVVKLSGVTLTQHQCLLPAVNLWLVTYALEKWGRYYFLLILIREMIFIQLILYKILTTLLVDNNFVILTLLKE